LLVWLCSVVLFICCYCSFCFVWLFLFVRSFFGSHFIACLLVCLLFACLLVCALVKLVNTKTDGLFVVRCFVWGISMHVLDELGV
jgi:hypothetical protein